MLLRPTRVPSFLTIISDCASSTCKPFYSFTLNRKPWLLFYKDYRSNERVNSSCCRHQRCKLTSNCIPSIIVSSYYHRRVFFYFIKISSSVSMSCPLLSFQEPETQWLAFPFLALTFKLSLFAGCIAGLSGDTCVYGVKVIVYMNIPDFNTILSHF